MVKTKVVLITGASGDIGQGLCEKYIELGAIVIAQYHSNIKPLQDIGLAKGIAGKSLLPFKANFSNENEIRSLFNFIQTEFNRLDVLVNNAGVLPEKVDYLHNSDYLDFKRILDINIISQYICATLAFNLMKEQASGHIVNVGSLAGMMPNYKNAFYSVSKAGVEMLTKCMALEWAEYNIKVNCVSPAALDSTMAKQLYDTESKLNERTGAIPLKKLVEVSSVVNTISFLTSGENKDITGSNIIIDGGSVISYFKNLQTKP